MFFRRRRAALVVALAAFLAASSAFVSAQLPREFGFFGGLRGEQGDEPEIPSDNLPDRNFVTCRMFYTSVRREANGAGWRTDYPWGERHLMLRLSELTKTRVSLLEPGTPHAWLVRLTDPSLFQCPYLVGSDVGTLG